MRLIDADTLNDYVMDTWGGGNIDNTAIWYGDVFKAIHNAPTIDAVPVVRCKDCVYRYKGYICGISGDFTGDNEFCCKGKREDKGNEN